MEYHNSRNRSSSTRNSGSYRVHDNYYKLIGIQHEKKHGKGNKNSSIYFDNKIVEVEEEEMEKQIREYMGIRENILKRVILP